ncbi:methylmalonyl-CoA mutase family protein [Epilithonimonas arachidiradicis]|uniref:Methylmalonyl-CoA mutase n=1 Tax=Epilithonimonas arachidiradicis TaxID=1617282 RepID=A0A420CXG6_9FLAO|nr:methylmalonyl-CoA mutase family protein [Epilithonimonas arachidiradicis]RKE83163.1 methylmalonyl-CoA mutase [Epilithonimonas arachidiradicis]GGG65410.1 methylmalonyl-CoA mutase [Epilithonimonas arachidiradicis]
MSGFDNWEKLVQKQLKTDDIYAILQKENLENIDVKPYYQNNSETKILPKVEESTHLVAEYQDGLEEQAFAFLLNENVEGLEEKAIFINNPDLAEHILTEETNRYFSLIDVFSDDKNAKINEHLAGELLSKAFERQIGIDVSLHQNAGASIIQQLAFALGKSKELVEKFGPEILEKLVFRLAIGSNYFFEIAKIRAFKYLFNQLSKEFEKDLIPYIFAETSLRNKAKNDEENNLIRSTLELASAMISGADAVFSNDHKIENQTELSKEISFKQQVVLAYESIINVFEDASSGSYFVEDITQQFAEKSWKLFLEIEEKDGYLALLKSGDIQKMIFEHATREQSWVEEGKIKLIGVNLYPKLEVKKTIAELYNVDEIKKVRLAEMFE